MNNQCVCGHQKEEHKIGDRTTCLGVPKLHEGRHYCSCTKYQVRNGKTEFYSPRTKVACHITGQDRNEDNAVAHIYACRTNTMDPFAPMCVRGWNRSDGAGFSIFRGLVGNVGVCHTCQKRSNAGLPPVKSRYRKTKWI